MVKLLLYNRLFYNQLRQIHSYINNMSVSAPSVEKENKAFQDVLPEFIDSVVTTTKVKELPEVATWLNQIQLPQHHVQVAMYDLQMFFCSGLLLARYSNSEMAKLFQRSRMFYNQLRQLHSNNMSGSTFGVEKEKKAFQDVLPEFIESVVTTTKVKELPEVATWLKQVLNYVLPGGKLSRGFITSVGYKMFEEPEYFSERTQHDAHILGWCIQMMHATFIVLDDIADGGTMRHNKTCWHLQRNISLYAVNDALIMQQAMMDMLNTHFGKSPIYTDLINYFNEAMYRTIMGEHLDLCSNYNKDTDNVEVFNMSRLHDTAVNKTGCYSFKLPIFTALLLVKNGRQLATAELHDLCYGIGRLMQVQDDYLDVYGTETITGKTSRDIQEGKATWLSATALQRCNSAQLSIFKEYYGSNDLEHVQRIKQLYDELNLPDVYEQYELKMYDDLLHQIKEMPHEGGKILLTEILNSCFKRVK